MIFPIVFLWWSYSFSMVFLWFSMVFLWFSHGCHLRSALWLANVQVELDKLLAVRLRDAGDVRKLFDALKV